MSTKPAIVIAQGSWQKGSAWNLFVEKLRAAGYPAEHVDLPSIGSTATPLPGLPEDIAAIRSVISRFRDIGRKVVVLCHSSGGVSGSNAVAGCDNVSGVIYMAAFVPLKGKALTQAPNGPPQPWIDVQVLDTNVIVFTRHYSALTLNLRVIDISSERNFSQLPSSTILTRKARTMRLMRSVILLPSCSKGSRRMSLGLKVCLARTSCVPKTRPFICLTNSKWRLGLGHER